MCTLLVFTEGVRKDLPTIQLHVQIQLHVPVKSVTANVIAKCMVLFRSLQPSTGIIQFRLHTRKHKNIITYASMCIFPWAQTFYPSATGGSASAFHTTEDYNCKYKYNYTYLLSQ